MFRRGPSNDISHLKIKVNYLDTVNIFLIRSKVVFSHCENYWLIETLEIPCFKIH